MRCPECDSKRVVTFLYGANSPRRVHYCKACKKLFYIKVEAIEPCICCKCKQPIIADASKYILLGSNKVRHRRCPKLKKIYN